MRCVLCAPDQCAVCCALCHSSQRRHVQVPRTLGSPWTLRRHWIEGGHLFPLSPSSLFFGPQTYTSSYQRALHLLSPAAHCARLVSAPLLAALPFACCVLRICPYGMDQRLFWTHLMYGTLAALLPLYHRNPVRAEAALGACMTARVLWLSAAKACINTMLTHAGVLRPGHYQSQHHNAAHTLAEVAVTGEIPDLKSPAAPDRPATPTRQERHGPPHTAGKPHACARLDSASVAWAPLLPFLLAITAAVVGIRRLVTRAAAVEWSDGRDSLVWASVAAALVDALPGALALGCALLAYKQTTSSSAPAAVP